jgi:hypothetical protein
MAIANLTGESAHERVLREYQSGARTDHAESAVTVAPVVTPRGASVQIAGAL